MAGRYGNIRLPTGVTTEEVHAALELDDPPQVHAGILTLRAWLHAVSKAYGMAFPVPRPPRTPTPAVPAPRPARVSVANKLPDMFCSPVHAFHCLMLDCLWLKSDLQVVQV